jgi:Flp pilus assembly protein TadG
MSTFNKACKRRGKVSERGASLVETAVASSVLLAMLFGIFQLSLALYTYHYISEAAREGSRWAIVRGSTSCTNTPNLDDCGATTAQINSFVKSLGYPGIDAADNMTVTTSFLSASSTQPTTWTTCSTSPCNVPGNLVKVQVQYRFPLSVPFVTVTTLNMSSTSQLAIAQ